MDIADRIQVEIESSRKTGSAICKIYRGNASSVEEGCKKLGLLKTALSYCKEVDKKQAVEIIAKALSFHLEGEIEEVMEMEKANKFANEFIEALPKNAKLYTNEIWGGNEPLTNYDFDTGILAVNNGLVGILWVMDNVSP